MINRKKIKPNDYPDPDYCILDLINVHLKVVLFYCYFSQNFMCKISVSRLTCLIQMNFLNFTSYYHLIKGYPNVK